MTVNVPQTGSTLTITEDWQVQLKWVDRNLRMLKAFKLTGMVEAYRWTEEKVTPDGKSETVERVQRKTIPNKLFMDDNGRFVPVNVTFPSGTSFTLVRYDMGFKNSTYCIRTIDLKCSGSEKKGIKGLMIQIPLREFNGMPATITDGPES